LFKHRKKRKTVEENNANNKTTQLNTSPKNNEDNNTTRVKKDTNNRDYLEAFSENTKKHRINRNVFNRFYNYLSSKNIL